MGKEKKKNEFKTLYPYIKKYGWYYFFGLLFLGLTNFGQIVIPRFLKETINEIESGVSDQRSIAILVLIMIGIALLVAAGRFGWRYFIHGASRNIETIMRGKLFDHILKLPPSFFAKTKTGDIMARATNDMLAIRRGTGMALVALVDGIFMTAFILFAIFKWYPEIALLLILPLPLLTVGVFFIAPFARKFFRKQRECYSNINNDAQETLTGIRMIKSFSRENFVLKRFNKVNDESIKANMNLVMLFGVMHPFIQFLSGLTIFMLIRFGAPLVLEKTLSTGDFVAAISYLGMLIWPLMGMGWTIQLFQGSIASLKRINSILEIEPQQDEWSKEGSGTLTDLKGCSVKVDSLDFSYKESEDTLLKNINLELKCGETLGILGRTGCGKSTLVKLLCGLLDPPEGTVFLGDNEIHQYDLKSLRSTFGMVLQDNFLFSKSVKDNIGFGNSNSNFDDIKKSAEISTIDRDLKVFPKGWETMVGERGVTLSGGQKQRIAISRALLAKPEILVLDDSLSAVDANTEEKILLDLFEERKGKTNILISHRYSTLMRADKIIVMEDGQISQQGTHDQLIQDDGFYKEIYDLQRFESEEEAAI